MLTRRRFGMAIAATLAASTLVACSSSTPEDAGTVAETIRIGSTDVDQEEWAVFEELAAKEGLDVEIVPFSDYSTPNDALVQGSLDVNKFQHLSFLAQYNVGANADLVPVASAEIYPLALYWKDHDSLDGIDGQEVAVPNDPTNQGRAINLLAANGLLVLKENSPLTPTPADIDREQSRVSVLPVDAAQTTVAYDSGDPAVVNNTFVRKAGLDPTASILEDDPNDPTAEPYINVWVTTPAKANDERIARLTELWKDPAVEEAVMKTSGGTAVPVERPREELEAILSKLEEEQAQQ